MNLRGIRWRRIIIPIVLIALTVFIYQGWADYSQRKTAYEQSKGTWQNAYDNGVLIKETVEKKVSGNHIIEVSYRLYDTTGDGIPDFENVLKWGKPTSWKYADEEGKPYG